MTLSLYVTLTVIVTSLFLIVVLWNPSTGGVMLGWWLGQLAARLELTWQRQRQSRLGGPR